MWVPEERRTLYHAGLAHGANHLVTLVTQAMELLARPAGAARPGRARCARCSPPRSTTRWPQGDAALTGPIVRGDVEHRRAPTSPTSPRTAPQTAAVVRRAGPAPPLDRVVTDGRVLPIRAGQLPTCSTPPCAGAATAAAAPTTAARR